MTAGLRTQSLRTCLGAGADLGHGVLLTGEYRVDTRAWALDTSTRRCGDATPRIPPYADQRRLDRRRRVRYVARWASRSAPTARCSRSSPCAPSRRPTCGRAIG